MEPSLFSHSAKNDEKDSSRATVSAAASKDRGRKIATTKPQHGEAFAVSRKRKHKASRESHLLPLSAHVSKHALKIVGAHSSVMVSELTKLVAPTGEKPFTSDRTPTQTVSQHEKEKRKLLRRVRHPYSSLRVHFNGQQWQHYGQQL